MSDFDKKRQEVLDLWESLFRICKNMVKDVENGDAKLNASLLKEMNQFLKLSIDVIVNAEENEYQADAVTEIYKDIVLPSFEEDDLRI